MRRYAVVMLLLMALAAFLRLHNMPDRAFLASDVWLWTIGINLHGTPVFNLGAHTTENFLKSLIATPYGWADTLPYYVASGIYDLLGIPLSEFWLYFMHVFLALASITLLYYLGKIMFGSRRIGLMAAAILAILPIDISVFGSGLAYHHNFLIFLQLILVIGVIRYASGRNAVNSVFMATALCLNAGTENLIMLPLAAALAYAPNRRFGVRDILVWLPSAVVIGLLYYIAVAYGESNVGILRYVNTKFVGGAGASDLLLLIERQARLVYENFYGIFFPVVCVISTVYISRNRGKSDAKFMWLWAWFLFMFILNAALKQGDYITTFRYSHMFVPLILISAFSVDYVLRSRRGIMLPAAVLLAVYFLSAAVSETNIALSRKVYSNPIKAVSFYVRESGGRDRTVFQLVPAGSRKNYWGEYYFGKTYIEPPGWTGLSRQLFSFGNHSVEEYKDAYGLKDFDFYVEYFNDTEGEAAKEKAEFLKSLARRGLMKTADIKRGDDLIASVYSARPLPYQVVDADLADKMWDKKYANLKNLLQNKWAGLAVLRGYHHRID